jgi:hypothetical protein
MKSSRYFVFNHSVLLCPNLYSANLHNSLRTRPILFFVPSTALHWLKSQSQLLHDWQFTANHFVLTPSPLRFMARMIFSHLNTCGHSPYVLTREWVCRLELLLALASAFILRSESRRTHDHILLSQIRDFPNLELRSPYLYPPRKKVAQLYPPALGSLSVAFHDSQGYGRGNSNPPPHSVGQVSYTLTHKFEAGRIQDIA